MRRTFWLKWFVCLSLSLPLAAQKDTGVIRGLVTDPSGAVVSGATVTVTSASTGQSRSASSNAAGEYVVPELQPGTYEVRVKQAGFKEFVSKDVQLFVSSIAVVNASMQVGNITEEVTVEANPVQVETTTGAVGNVVEGREVRELPLNGRSFV